MKYIAQLFATTLAFPGLLAWTPYYPSNNRENSMKFSTVEKENGVNVFSHDNENEEQEVGMAELSGQRVVPVGERIRRKISIDENRKASVLSRTVPICGDWAVTVS